MARTTARYVVDRDYTISEIDRRLYGSFVEHLGRTVYNGIHEPTHRTADELGFRGDVIDAVKEAHISLVRYPGGNFVSGYDWKDGIGPVANRPTRLDPAWAAVEPNTVGLNEFASWAKKASVEFMGVVNLGTGTAKEAGQQLEYCNYPGGTYWSDLRRSHGAADPHNIRLWCLGNEMDGEWQIGALSPEDYGKKAADTAKLMKMIDPSIELAACGSCCCETPTYPDWDRIVLEHLYDKVEYLSLHRYYTYDPLKHLFYKSDDDRTDIAHFSIDLAEYLHTVISAADFVKTKVHSKRTMLISFDEWNVISASNPPATHRERWAPTPETGEEVFSTLDALVYGGLLCTFLKHSDRVKVACQSLLVNTGGMFYTQKGGALVRNTTFYPFQHVATYGKGVALRDVLSGPNIETNHYGEVPAVQSAAVWNDEEQVLNLFLVNFSPDSVELAMDLRSFGDFSSWEQIVLASESLNDVNNLANPTHVIPSRKRHGALSGGTVTVELRPSSWNVMRFSKKPVL